jgi:hypothetical protein
LLEKDPDVRIKPKDALLHDWFKKFELQANGNNNIPIEECKALEIVFDDTKITNVGHQNAFGLASATPIMAGRKIEHLAPESPFLTGKDL